MKIILTAPCIKYNCNQYRNNKCRYEGLECADWEFYKDEVSIYKKYKNDIFELLKMVKNAK